MRPTSGSADAQSWQSIRLKFAPALDTTTILLLAAIFELCTSSLDDGQQQARNLY
jgi:hypothetical protein